MIKIIINTLTIFFLICICTNQISAQQVKKIKMDALVAYAEKADHPVIINMWATWCTPCVEEIPWFNKILNQQTDSSIELILVSLDFEDKYESAVAKFIEKNPTKATLYWLDETKADYFCPLLDKSWSGNLPVSLFLNNKTGYRIFFDDQIKENFLEQAISDMLEE